MIGRLVPGADARVAHREGLGSVRLARAADHAAFDDVDAGRIKRAHELEADVFVEGLQLVAVAFQIAVDAQFVCAVEEGRDQASESARSAAFRVDGPCEEVDMGETNAYHFSLKGEQKFSALSEEDIKILDVVIEKLGRMSKNEIVSFMHKEQAYERTLPRDIIFFEYAKQLRI